MKLSEIDKNFIVRNTTRTEGVTYYNADDIPFALYGIFKENGRYRRIPEQIAKTVNEGVYYLHTNTAGGRVRFITDSSFVSIVVKTDKIEKMQHFALTGSAGFDMYVSDEYIKTFAPPFEASESFAGDYDFGSKEKREITINFPLYNDVCELYIGLDDDAVTEPPSPYKNSMPVVYYGSSITQGGCASRPGMSYQSIISRRFNYDYINLGFSGSARAEDEMIDYLKGLPMSLFVLDYDHNAPTAEHLLSTHEKLFKAVREQNPALPIIMMSRPRFNLSGEETDRLHIIEATYNNALSSGDKNVYLLNNEALTALCKGEGTVDGCHPTDFGFASMAQALGDLMENISI